MEQQRDSGSFVPISEGLCLFLDVVGTLLEFTESPMVISA
jgi:hypothetical protein